MPEKRTEVWAVPPDNIEDAKIALDEGELYLVLQGDFVRTMEAYLKDIDSEAIALKISGEIADGLCNSLYEIKHGG